MKVGISIWLQKISVLLEKAVNQYNKQTIET